MTAPFSTRVTPGSGLLLVLVGAMVLIGWAFDVRLLKAVFGPITMKANAALGLLAAGLALGLLSVMSRPARLAGSAAAVFVTALGAATLSQHLFAWNLGIDQLLFAEPPGAAATTSPGRMGPNASLSLTLGGTALLCLYRGTPRTIAWAQALGACITVLALIPAVGYLYGATQLYAIARYTGIALHTSLALIVLGAGVLAARSGEGLVAALVADAPHGVMARRLILLSLVVPLMLGYLRVIGERRGWYDVGLGASLFVVAMIVLLSLTTWRTAVAQARTHARLKRAERHRDELLASERAARQKAEQADRAKDEFIAALSHELRTPLNAILGWMYMLRRDTVPADARGKAGDAVVRNASLLARLIEDLLDTSRITTGRLALTRDRIDVEAVVRSAIDSVLPASEGKQVVVTFESAAGLPPIVGDAQRLQQVVWNLLSNAIKFSPPGSAVAVRILQDLDHLVVTVRDEGAGIDPAFLPRMFERFQQADATQARSNSGLGLGLYIARHLVQLHGGSLEAHSDGPGTGALFTMRLPAAPQPPPGPSLPDVPAQVDPGSPFAGV